MANRGGHNNRGRGSKRGGRFNQTPRTEHIRDRLGQIPTYQRVTDRIPSKKDKYKVVYRQNVISTSLATVPGDTKIKALGKEFIKSYYEIFDQQGRPNLHTKYSPDAIFTFSTTFSMPPPTHFGRNLLQVSRDMRDSLLIRNKAETSMTQIADLFAGFPHTKHMTQNFTYDIPFYLVNPMYVTSMHIIVTGVYEDLTTSVDPLRAFTRVFIVKQKSVTDDGEPIYEIFNDLFMLQTPTPEQIKKYHSDSQNARRLAGANQDRLSTTNQPIGNYTPKQEELIGRVMNQTRMTRKGASQLLEENKWDEANSMQVYESLNRDGLIPPELFQQPR